jgi:pantoate--beta-alanine ligase
MTVVLGTVAAAREWSRTGRASGKTLGFVPTMGALHEGHLSLIRRARESCRQVVVSIFVNPLQFGPGEDYERYPRDFERDLAFIEREGVDAVFHPSAAEMYSNQPLISVDVGKLGDTLDGVSRPGHFRGVATVVAKLFHIIEPDRAFFGQKDAQQAIILQRMVADLNFPLEIEVCPTVREPDGLAMSSRNAYLNPQERANATILYRSLQHAVELIHSGLREASKVEAEMRSMIESTPGADLDYAKIVDLHTLVDVSCVEREALIAVAVRFGKTRLIDNLIVRTDSRERIG